MNYPHLPLTSDMPCGESGKLHGKTLLEKRLEGRKSW